MLETAFLFTSQLRRAHPGQDLQKPREGLLRTPGIESTTPLPIPHKSAGICNTATASDHTHAGALMEQPPLERVLMNGAGSNSH